LQHFVQVRGAPARLGEQGRAQTPRKSERAALDQALDTRRLNLLAADAVREVGEIGERPASRRAAK